ncbi:unnamed protein product [Sphagnum troendelagicum]|uniref:Glyoxal oxidase n=1 Tax=Sphagnum troendelagicum TaxID=128251 RepID=A0ABP0UNV3_9BRYO
MGVSEKSYMMRTVASRGSLVQQLLQVLLFCSLVALLLQQVAAQGSWKVIVENAGIASMHTAITHYNTAVLLDRTDIGPSQLPLPNGVCRNDPDDESSKHDCTAHSALLDLATNTIRPLFVQTDTWCSSGQFRADGTLVQTGGDNDGLSKIRTFAPCPGDGDCNWVETNVPLQNGRWYASNAQLPDGTQIVVGGRGIATLEYVPPNGRGTTYIPLIANANDAQNDNLYPYVHLLPNNQIFIFANQDSLLYDWQTNKVAKNLPVLPGGPRNYPSAGSSALLPLSGFNGWADVEILICGGATYGAFLNPGAALPATQSCGRIAPLSANPGWALENMPLRRNMGELLLLPDRNVFIVNGAANGAQGWGNAQNPVLTPVLYNPNGAPGTRFQTLTATDIPRVYHSTANVLPDGRILIAGSNTHQFYTLTGYLPTELRIEAHTPYYIGAGARPVIANAPGELAYGARFTATVDNGNAKFIDLNLLSAPYSTHSFSQGQRLLQLATSAPAAVGGGSYTVTATAPPTSVIAPSAYYMLFAVSDGFPSVAQWVHIG